MEVISIDKSKNPDIADSVADFQPGDTITLKTTIRRNDDAILELTVEDAEGEARDPDKEVGEEEETEEELEERT